MSRPRCDPSRTADMVALFRAGQTQQQIGDRYGVTRERVRQLLIAEGLGRNDGGAAIRKARRTHATTQRISRARHERAFRAYGCDYDTLMNICAGFKNIRDAGCPARLYKEQQNAAKTRRVEWAITLPEWYRVWQESGHWHERGLCDGEYVMARRGDVGPYAVWNIYITPSRENLNDARAYRRLLGTQESA